MSRLGRLRNATCDRSGCQMSSRQLIIFRDEMTGEKLGERRLCDTHAMLLQVEMIQLGLTQSEERVEGARILRRRR